MPVTNYQKPKQNSVQKKRNASHHKKTKQYSNAYWPYLPILVVVLAGFLLNSFWTGKSGVLDYAIDTAPQSLLESTNEQRINHNLTELSLNQQLSEAAQDKAEDMVNRGYWSHETPDGQQPWAFIANAGYQYKTAGENLAFGFPTSKDTVTAWMNSPGHKANILNTTYSEVGFGIANSANYQGKGNETIVVAMYASPLSGVAQTPPITINTSPENSDTLVSAAPAAVASSTSQRISRIQLLSSGSAGWSIAVVSVLLFTLGTVFVWRHGHAWRKALVHGEEFIINHKILDITIVVIIVACILLMQTTGFIH